MREPFSKPSSTITFNKIAAGAGIEVDNSLTFAVRTDAAYAIGGIREKVLDHVARSRLNALSGASDLEKDVPAILDNAYAEWGRSVIHALVASIDYKNYGLCNEENKNVDIHLHNARWLSRQVVESARTFMKTGDENSPVIYVSLDEMIRGEGDDRAEVGFSRLFSHDGKTQGGYVGRPGKLPLDEQIEQLKERLIETVEKTGKRPSFVMLEDNVRHAKTINWIIGEMDRAGVFEHGDLGAISTCFCCASDEEQKKIQYADKVVPLVSVVNYEGIKTDVITPRDLLFDGYVVKLEDGLSRLPGLFMDVEKLFKIRPERVDVFKDEVRRASVKFCDDIYSRTGYELKVQDLTPGKAMQEILKCRPTDLVSDVIMAHSAREIRVAPAHDSGPKPISG